LVGFGDNLGVFHIEWAFEGFHNTLKPKKRVCHRGIALCNDEKGDLNGIVSLFVECNL